MNNLFTISFFSLFSAHNHLQNTNEIPKKLAYSLRFPAVLRMESQRHWQTHLIYSFGAHISNYVSNRRDAYYEEGFLAIQNAIAGAYVNITTNTSMPNIHMQRLPVPRHFVDVTAHTFRAMMPLFFMIVLWFVFINTVRVISMEKEKQLKEAMKIMGLTNWMHYLGWFIRTLIMLSIIMAIISILLTVKLISLEFI